jgi:multiple sugar transport system substrate-binding protein
VALPLKWKDEDKIYTGFHGGAAWTVSNHTKNPKLAVDFAVFMSSSHDYQDTAVTFPAFLPAADVWAKTVAGNAVYAFDPYPVLKEAAGMMTNEGLGNVRYDWQQPFNTDVIAAIQNGETIVSALPKLQETYKGLAEAQGYEVVTK